MDWLFFLLSATLTAIGAKDARYEWKLPPFTFLIPQPEPVPVCQPLNVLASD